MPQIQNGQGLDIAVPPGQSIAISSISGTYSASLLYGTKDTLATNSDGGATFGPYASGNTVRLTAGNSSVIAYEVGSSPSAQSALVPTYATDSAGNVTGLVGPDGKAAPVPVKLQRWRKKMKTDAANAKIVLIGDSTSDYTTSSSALTNRLRLWHTQPGQALYGLQGDASHVIAQGVNGISLLAWLNDSTKITALAAESPDLVIASFGLNDVRLGACTLDQMQQRLITLVSLITDRLPNADILLRMPNPMLTTNVSNLNYVQDSLGNINPSGAAQSYSKILRDAYLSLGGRWGHVDVIDIQALVFGTTSRSSHVLMADQLHPTPLGSTIGGIQPTGGGYIEIADAIAERIGVPSNNFVLSGNQYRVWREFNCSAGGNGYIDISAVNGSSESAAQFPLATSDVLFVNGIASPISLSGATIYRPFGGTNIRVAVSGDYTSCVGHRVFVGAGHADRTTGDRQIVSVDLPSIGAGAVASTTASVSGARTGALHDATAVACTPPAAFVSAGLVLLGCYPSANDTVTLVVQNPTASAVDLVASNFAFFVIR